MADVAKSGKESHALSGVWGGLDLLDQEGNQHAGDDGVAGAAELTHDQLGEHVEALGGVDAGLVDQARQGKSGSDLKLLVAHDDIRLQEFVEAGQELLGGSLDGGDKSGDHLDSPFTGDLSLEDEIADNHQGGVGSGQHQSIGDDLVRGAPFLVFPDLVDESVKLGPVEGREDSAEHVNLVGNLLLRGLVVVVLAFELSDDFSPKALSFLLQDLSLNFHDHGGIDATKRGLSHEGAVGLVVIIVRVSEGLVGVRIGRDAGHQLGGTSGSGGPEVEVLDSQTFSSFGFVAEGLGHQLVNRVDALDDEVTLVGSATDDPGVFNVREFVFAACTIDQVAVETRVGVVLVVRQDAALVEVAVLNDLVDGEAVFAKLGSGQKLRLGLDSLNRQTADGIPGVALAGNGSLDGVISGVLSVVVVVFILVEDTRGAVKLNLDLGSEGTLEVDDPQRRLLADGDALNLEKREII